MRLINKSLFKLLLFILFVTVIFLVISPMANNSLLLAEWINSSDNTMLDTIQIAAPNESEDRIEVCTTGSVANDGTVISVPYSVFGSDLVDATQLSEVILNKECSFDNTDITTIVSYDKLCDLTNRSGVASFSLPDSLSISDSGTHYYICLLVDDINGQYEMDYASESFLIDYSPAINVASGECGDNLTWVLDSNGTLTISGYGDMEDHKVDNVPWAAYREQIVSVVFSGNITSIGRGAFNGCTNLTNITIPDSVTSIGAWSFSRINNLTSVVIPNGITTLSDCAFYGNTGLTTIVIPDSVTSIGTSTFQDCTNLTDVVIPESVTSIGSGAFNGCTSITNITIPDSVTSIDDWVFANNTNLTAIVIPDSITRIPDCAFWGCTGLSSVTIPDSVTSIGEAAFQNCTNLSSIVIPYNVTTINDRAFKDCSNLSFVVLNEDAYRQEAFPDIDNNNIIYYYDVVYDSNGHGTISGSARTYETEALIITVIPDDGYALGQIVWSDGVDEIVLVADANGMYIMPKSSELVEIRGYFVCAHNELVDDPAEAPTCTETGLTAGSHCSICGEVIVEQEVVPATGHTIVIDEAVEPTDSTPGLTEGSHCSVCGAIIIPQEIIPVITPTPDPTTTTPTPDPTTTTPTPESTTTTPTPESTTTTPTPDPTTTTPTDAPAPVGTVNMYRLYNPNSGEHFYTSNQGERDVLIQLGWNYEGIGWLAPVTSNTPVYRLYNQYGGEHHYTTSIGERDMLISVGWSYEGIGWYSDDQERVPLYRQYNPNAFANNHNYTVSRRENDWLVSLGWRAEGIGWYGVG